MAISAFIKRDPILSYFALTFVLSWGAILIVTGGLGGIPIASEQIPIVGAVILLGPSLASILLTGLCDGRAGYVELLHKIRTWRVGVRWYAIALLGAPLLATLVLMALSLFSSEFVPAIFSADDKLSLLLMGIGMGLLVGFFEELGWTAFAVPRMRLRYSVLGTGFIIGILWGAWHFPLFWESDTFTGSLPFFLLLARLLAWLPPFRVLMVWIYDRTESLLVVMLMHASLVATTLILPSMELSGMALLTWLLVWAAVLWVVVGVIGVINNRQLST